MNRVPISSVETDQGVVALTFDDGPHAANTPRLLEIFARENVKATFFEVGHNVAKYPALARAILGSGHEIGNHSQTHPDLGKMTEVADVRAEIVGAQEIIKDATGFTPVVFRAPYLSHGHDVWTVLDELGLLSIGRMHSGRDWESVSTMNSIVDHCAKTEAGEIVLLHSWPDKTLDALPRIIRHLRAKGLRFATVPELLRLS